MTNKRFACAIIGVVSLLLVPSVAPAGSHSPTEWVQTTVAEMQNVLPEQGGTLTPAQVKVVSRLVDDSFHFPKLAQMVLGRHWKNRTPTERREFITLFQQLLEKSHFMKMATEGKAEQRFVGEEIEKDRAIVQAVAKVDDNEIPIEYILVRQNGTWKIYDLGVDGMRLSEIYRSQFNKVISRSSYEDLIQRMKMKLEEIELEQKASVPSYSQVSTSR